MDNSPPNHIVSSFIASLCAVSASTPVDVIRTRLMSQKVHRSNDSNEIKPGKIYRGSWDCFTTTLKHEGVRALYRGFLPAWFRMGPWNLIFFTSYEQLLKLYWCWLGGYWTATVNPSRSLLITFIGTTLLHLLGKKIWFTYTYELMNISQLSILHWKCWTNWPWWHHCILENVI